MFAMEEGLCPPGKEVVMVHGCIKADAEVGLPMVASQVRGRGRAGRGGYGRKTPRVKVAIGVSVGPRVHAYPWHLS
jgi:hypothetical protein